MSDIKENVKKLNEMILSGKGMEAFEKYYHEDVVMQENNQAPTVGKEANHKRESESMSAVQEFHGAEVKGVAIGDNTSMVEWSFDMTYQGGNRVKLNQVAVQRWKDGQIINERFYYSNN